VGRCIGRLGYSISRQKGSHIRITTEVNGVHHVTVPDHSPIKVGMLAAILRDVGQHHGMDRNALLNLLFWPVSRSTAVWIGNGSCSICF